MKCLENQINRRWEETKTENFDFEKFLVLFQKVNKEPVIPVPDKYLLLSWCFVGHEMADLIL